MKKTQSNFIYYSGAVYVLSVPLKKNILFFQLEYLFQIILIPYFIVKYITVI